MSAKKLLLLLLSIVFLKVNNQTIEMVESDESSHHLKARRATCRLKDFYMPNSQEIGKGEFGVVKRVRHKETGKWYAMKIINIKDDRAQQCFEREVQATLNSDSPFIVPMLCSFQETGTQKGYIVLELAAGGDFHHFLLKNRPSSAGQYMALEEHQVKFYAANMVMAVEYLHNQNIMHRDIKPKNFLVTEKGYLQLADFGLCSLLEQNTIAYTPCGSRAYLAPEIVIAFHEQRGSTGGYTKAVDWWSVGATLLELFTGESQFSGSALGEIFDKILYKKIEIPDHLTPAARNLLTRLLEREPTQRLGYYGPAAVKRHPFFEGFEWERLQAFQIEAPYKPPIPTQEEESDATTNKAPKTRVITKHQEEGCSPSYQRRKYKKNTTCCIIQ